jgi:hypothetical protein
MEVVNNDAVDLFIGFIGQASHAVGLPQRRFRGIFWYRSWANVPSLFRDRDFVPRLRLSVMLSASARRRSRHRAERGGHFTHDWLCAGDAVSLCDQLGFADAIKNANSSLFELARVLVRLNHIARFIVNANHGIFERR